MVVDRLLYEAHTTATGGREGRVVSSNGILDLKLTLPRQLGGSGQPGTNPEQLFAAAYSACFIGAMKFVADREKIALPDDISIEASVGLGTGPNGFDLDVTLWILVPGLPRGETESLVRLARGVCPYSNALRGNINVQLFVA